VASGVLLVSRVALPPHRRDPEHVGTVRHDVAEGIRWTVRHPAVRTLALTILVFNVTFGAAWSVLVLYARDRLGLGAIGYGVLTRIAHGDEPGHEPAMDGEGTHAGEGRIAR